MSSENINRSAPFMLSNGGTVRSVSVLLYDPELGFMLTEEERKGFPDPSVKTLNTHPVGGKVDDTDKSPFYTGLREFCEEVDYTLEGYNIEETVCLLLEAFEPATKRYKDILVSKPKNLYNRFYIVNISEVLDEEIRMSLYNKIQNWRTKPGSVLRRVFFWKRGDEMRVSPSSLMENLLKNLPNESKCSKRR